MAQDKTELSVPGFCRAGLLQCTHSWSVSAQAAVLGSEGTKSVPGAPALKGNVLSEPSPVLARAGVRVWYQTRVQCPPFSFRYSNHRFHPGVVPAHRSVRVSPSYVLLLRLSSSCLYNMHSRWLSFLLFIRLGIEQKVLLVRIIIHVTVH